MFYLLSSYLGKRRNKASEVGKLIVNEFEPENNMFLSTGLNLTIVLSLSQFYL